MEEEDKTPASGWTLLKNGINRWAYDWRLALAVILAGSCGVLYAMLTDGQRSYQEPPATGAQVPGKVLPQPTPNEVSGDTDHQLKPADKN